MVSVTSINRKSLPRQQHRSSVLLPTPRKPHGAAVRPSSPAAQRLHISPTGRQSWKEERSSGLGALECWNTDQRDKALTDLREGSVSGVGRAYIFIDSGSKPVPCTDQARALQLSLPPNQSICFYFKVSTFVCLCMYTHMPPVCRHWLRSGGNASPGELPDTGTGH